MREGWDGPGGGVGASEPARRQTGSARLRQRPPVLGPHGHADGHGCPHQDVLAAGVGPLVETGDGRPAVVGQPHVERRGRRTDHGHREHRPQPAGGLQPATQMEQDQRHRRPHDVELLLDRQRPHVRHRGGLGGLGEVVGPGEDEVPVGHVEEGRQRVEPQVGELAGGGEDLGVDGHAHQHQQQGRQEAPGPPRPELPQPDGQPLGPLAQQERGDQEARQDEEDVDAQEASAGQRRPAVVEHDPRDGDGPQPVEGRDEAEADRTAPGLRGQHQGLAGARHVDRSTHRDWVLRTRRCGPAPSPDGAPSCT